MDEALPTCHLDGQDRDCIDATCIACLRQIVSARGHGRLRNVRHGATRIAPLAMVTVPVSVGRCRVERSYRLHQWHQFIGQLAQLCQSGHAEPQHSANRGWQTLDHLVTDQVFADAKFRRRVSELMQERRWATGHLRLAYQTFK